MLHLKLMLNGASPQMILQVLMPVTKNYFDSNHCLKMNCE